MRSEQIKIGVERTPNRSLLYALGYTDEELARPLIGVVSSTAQIQQRHHRHQHRGNIRDAADAAQ